MKPTSSSLHRMNLLFTFKPQGGFSYGAPLLLDGDATDEPLRSKLISFEDGVPLRPSHDERHGTIAGTGLGA